MIFRTIFSLCFLLASSTLCAGDVEPKNMKGITAAHNSYRAKVKPAASPKLKPMQWKNSIAKDAQDWANQCTWEHGGKGLGRQYGQNMYAGSFKARPAAPVNSWYSEVKDYHYDSNSCNPGKVCGHYTQVVWASSTSVGCGVASCNRNSPFGPSFPRWEVWVCNYAGPGNYRGQKPYKSRGRSAEELDEVPEFELNGPLDETGMFMTSSYTPDEADGESHEEEEEEKEEEEEEKEDKKKSKKLRASSN